MPEPRRTARKEAAGPGADAIRTKHYSLRTEEAYVNWVRRFILYHGKRHPKDMGGPEIEAFLTPSWRSKAMCPPLRKIRPSTR